MAINYTVSIHAPAWGATSKARATVPLWDSFNPRARVGRDQLMETIIIYLLQFQSTRPRGARLVLYTHIAIT